jgi:phage N-6-adenine-methyltransferase
MHGQSGAEMVSLGSHVKRPRRVNPGDSRLSNGRIQAFGRYHQKGDDEYETPWTFVDYWNRRHHFDRDVCATAATTKCRKFWTKETNALIQQWDEKAGPAFFLNPPYARPKDAPADWGKSGLLPWVRKARTSTFTYNVIVGALLPVWSGELWHHKYLRHAEINFIRRRLTFISPNRDGKDNEAGFDSMFVIFRPDDRERGQRIRYVTCPVKDEPGDHRQIFSRRIKPTPKPDPIVPTQEGVVLSLFDRTGNIVKPWLEAGYECVAVDLQHPPGETKRGLLTLVGADIRTWWPRPRKYKIVFAAPPCQNLAVSGAPHFLAKGMGGLMAGLELVEAARRICDWSEALWMIENPTSILSSHWRASDFAFDPFEFGGYDGGMNDGYTKRTHLWTGGGFRMPDKKPILITRPNFIHHMPPSPDRGDLRSITPRGFAQAVFQANH